MIMAKVIPTGPESCRFVAHYLAQAGSDPERVERWIELWNQTYDEDALAVEMQQENLRSGRAQLFRYVSSQEETALFINGLIWQAYKEGFDQIAGPRATAAE